MNHHKIHLVIGLLFALYLSFVFLFARNFVNVLVIAGVILLAAIGIYAGACFSFYLLPGLIHKAINSYIGSNRNLDFDNMQEAQSAILSNNHKKALSIYHNITIAEPGNLRAWESKAKIELNHFKNPELAIKTLLRAIKSYEWSDTDEDYLQIKITDINRISKMKDFTEIQPPRPDTPSIKNAEDADLKV